MIQTAGCRLIVVTRHSRATNLGKPKFYQEAFINSSPHKWSQAHLCEFCEIDLARNKNQSPIYLHLPHSPAGTLRIFSDTPLFHL